MAKGRKTRVSPPKRTTAVPKETAKPRADSLDEWWHANRDELLRRAEANTRRLTGKPRL